MEVVFEIVYGSRLYGTSTPTSDTDIKRVYMPRIADLLLGTKLNISQSKFDAQGKAVGPKDPMPADGVEYSDIPISIYFDDFVKGQTYAVEMAMEFIKPEYSDHRFYSINRELVSRFLTRNITPMVGFASKQTMDYCQRGERLKVMQEIMKQLEAMEKKHGGETQLNKVVSGKTLMEAIAKKQNLEMKEQEHGHVSLEVNGRSYMENTTIMHLKGQIQKKIDRYGPRTTEASEEEVDWKSLSHAVRVYQQVIELAQYRTMTFPRPNADYLLSIKHGKEPIEVVRLLINELHSQVQDIEEANVLGLPDLATIRDEFQQWKETTIRYMYLV